MPATARRKANVKPVSGTVRWLRPLIVGKQLGRLAITNANGETTEYDLGAFIDADGAVQGFGLAKDDDEVHAIDTASGSGWSCDCPDCQFRGRECKHIKAVRVALKQAGIEVGGPKRPASAPRPAELDDLCEAGPAPDRDPEQRRGTRHHRTERHHRHQGVPVMAHEIDVTTGRAACFVAGTPPWHRLGVVVAEAQTSAEAIKLAGLDWTVEQWPLLARQGDIERPVAERVANVRSDTHAVLGVVSPGYRPFQNAEAFAFFDAVVQERLAIFETAGALKGGRHVWMLARLPQTLRAAPADEVKPYVLLTNAHDGSRALRLLPTTIRVVCQNTLNLALGRAGGTEGLTVYHSESLARRVQEAHDKLGIISRRVEAFGEQLGALARRQLTEAELTSYFVGLVKDRSETQQKKLLERLLENFHHPSNTLPGIAGTAWAAFNAVSHWTDHQAAVRGSTEAQRADARLSSIWLGGGAAIKQQAFDAALGLVQAA